MNLGTNNPKVPTIAREYAAKVRASLGAHVRQVILFGSHARGEATAASDYDFVVVVDKRERPLRDLIAKAGASLLYEKDVLCAALIYDGKQWAAIQGSPLGWNIVRDGVAL